MKQSQFYYLLRRGLFSAGSAIIKNGLVMFNKFTTAGISHPAQGSAEFNGTSDYIQLNDPFSYTNHTIAFWMYRNQTASGANYGIFDQRDGPGDGIVLADNTSNQIIYALNSGASRTSTAINSKEWVYVTASYDGTTMKLYLDGSLNQSASTSLTIDTNTNAVIGSKSYSASANIPFNGNLANVAIWNRALSSDEINSVMWKSYEALSGAESNGLQAWYSLDDITSPAASLANMEQLATDKNATIENKAAITAAINALS
jgi:hypothetical protein